MSVPTAVTDADLAVCAAEPIRIPGQIQPHGALLVLDPDTLKVLQASDNARAVIGLGLAPGDAQSLADLPVAQGLAAAIRSWLPQRRREFRHRLWSDGRELSVTAHLGPQGLLVEFESYQETENGTELLDVEFLRLHILERFVGAGSVNALAAGVVSEIRALTGCHRVLVYRFDRDGHGDILSEDGDGTLPSFVGLKFPASDIPPQARELYVQNRIRQIPDVGYRPVGITPPLSPVDGQPLDLSPVAVRSVSPIHREYMRNMGTAASMSISLVIDGRLWGLVSCHHAGPRTIDPDTRATCDVVCQIAAQQMGALERAEREAHAAQLRTVEVVLLEALSRDPKLADCLREQGEHWRRLTGADGVALVAGEQVVSFGLTPEENDLVALATELRAPERMVVTDSLLGLHPASPSVSSRVSGLLAVSISDGAPDYLMWFRRPVEQTVSWGGDQRQGKQADPAGTLRPRNSFEEWREEVRDRSLPWQDAEVDAARHIRIAVSALRLRQVVTEQARLTQQLASVNTELEGFAYTVAHDLRAPLRHIAHHTEAIHSQIDSQPDEPGRAFLSQVQSMVVSAEWGGRLIDDLLMFSRLSRDTLKSSVVDMTGMAASLRDSFQEQSAGREIEWRIGNLPVASGDATLLRQAMSNLFDNAVKYTAGRTPATVEIGGEETETEVVYTLRDNGIGFDMSYAGKLFGVFQRLHDPREFPGTGIGLASVRRIVERHGGRVFASGEPNVGATIGFALPRRPVGDHL